MIQGQYYEINTTEFFRRALVGDKLDEWEELVAKITHINWPNESDLFIWNLHNNGQFTVHSMYLHMINQNTPFSHKLIWKLKIPLKIKIFLWYLQKWVILTKDNLIKRNWKGSQKCCFYNCNKTIKYLFFDCHHVKTVWRTIYIATGLTPPSSVSHMLGSWLSNFDFKEKNIFWLG